MCCVVFCVVLCFLRAVCCEDRVPPTVNSTGSDDQPLLSHSTMRPATVSHFTLHRVPTLYQVQLATLKLYFTFPLFSTICSRFSHSRSTAFPKNRTFGSSTPMYVYDVAMKVWHVCVWLSPFKKYMCIVVPMLLCIARSGMCWHQYQFNWQTLSQMTGCSDLLSSAVEMLSSSVEISVRANEKLYCQSDGQGLHCTPSMGLPVGFYNLCPGNLYCVGNQPWLGFKPTVEGVS